VGKDEDLYNKDTQYSGGILFAEFVHNLWEDLVDHQEDKKYLLRLLSKHLNYSDSKIKLYEFIREAAINTLNALLWKNNSSKKDS